MAEVKRTQREDTAAKITRTVRDQGYRACGYDANSSEYAIIKWTLDRVRDEMRKQGI
jgi:ABC-type ATPase with predicted acetyltransferase domain